MVISLRAVFTVLPRPIQHAQLTIAAVARIARHQQVAEEIGWTESGEVFDTLRVKHKEHLFDAVGRQNRDKIVALAQAHSDAHHDSVDVLQHGRTL